MELHQEPSWIDPTLAYLKIDELPEEKIEAKVLTVKVSRYVVYGDKLYRRGYSMSLLRCVTPSEVNYIMREINKGICGNHAGRAVISIQGAQAGALLANNEV